MYTVQEHGFFLGSGNVKATVHLIVISNVFEGLCLSNMFGSIITIMHFKV